MTDRVLGYKIEDNNYLALKLLLTVIWFSIYKLYYISEQKTKDIDLYILFVNQKVTIQRNRQHIGSTKRGKTHTQKKQNKNTT